MTAEQGWGFDQSSEPLVIPLHVRGLARFFPAISAGVIVLAVARMVIDPSWDAYIWGGVAVVSFGWIWATVLAAGRARGAMPRQIVATAEGLQSSVWEISWDRVERIWIGRLAHSRQKTLVIEPRRPEDVRTPSRMLKLNIALSNALKAPQIQILQANVDRPLEEIAGEFERLAGRSLLMRDNTPA